MDNEKINRILRGRFDNVPKERSKVVRIFFSSTFSGKIIELNPIELFCEFGVKHNSKAFII